MSAARLKALRPIRCDLSSPGTLEQRGTFWCRFVQVGHSRLRCAPPSSTQPVSISRAPHRAGDERSSTLASCVSAGEHQRILTSYASLTLCFFITASLSHLFVLDCCPYRSVRFRWYQGFFSTGSAPPTWALDNVYIGPQCQDMCSGHGACVGGTHCMCDPGYSGSDCSVPDIPNPDFLKEDFEGTMQDSNSISGVVM